MKITTISRIRNTMSRSNRQWYFGLLILFVLTSVTGSYGQTGTVSIGTGTSVNTVFPINSCFGYNYSQQIVKASEFGAGGGVAGPITKIRFYYSGNGSTFANWNTWTVYLGHTAKTQFTSDTDWEPVANLTQVYSGTITPVAGNWMEITLTTPFPYNGTSNFIVAVDENIANWGCTADWGSYAGTANSGLYYYSDSTNPDPASPPTGTRSGTIARLQLVGNLASCLAPTGVTALANTTTTGTATWAASTSAPANGYQYYQSTSNTAPVAATVPTGSVGAGVLTAPLSGLTSNTTYYVWVRSACDATTNSAWSAAATFTTPCDATNVPYTQDFELATTPALPECTSIQNAGTGNLWHTINNPGSGFTSKTLRYSWNGVNAANVWFFTRAINMTAGTSYRVSYRYGNNSAATYTEKMKVAYGTANNAAAMTTQLANHSAIIGATPTSTYVDFTPTTSGIYYIGFHAYSIADQDQLYLDDISVTLSPSCLTPTALTAGTSTETSVALSWTASASTPTGGYQYFYTTSNTASPGAATTPSGTVGAGVLTATIGTLTSSTKYYVWVRSNCGAGSFSEWAGPIALTTLCDSPDLLSTTGGTICGEGSVQLQATSSAGSIKWYAASTGGLPLGTGGTFNSPVISATTTYYAEAVNSANAFVGASYTGTGNNGANVGSHGIRITTTQPNTVINSVDIPFTGTGTITIALKDLSNTTVITSVTSDEVTGDGTTPQTIDLNLTVAAPGSYLLLVNAVTGTVGSLGYSPGTYPYTSADGSFTVNGGYWYGNTTDNLYLYNLNVVTGCASVRQAVIATVTPAPAVTASVNDASICVGESVTLTAASANANYTYMWTPGNMAGPVQSVSPSATTTYIVTATDAGTNCVVTEEVTVTVNILPTALVLADNTAICEGGNAVALTVQGGVTPGTVLTQNFNGATNNWTTVNNSTGGTVANAAWTLRADGYVYGGSTYHSNDNTQFYYTNSDAQGSGSTTSTILQSPVFSTAGYTSANISFYHYFYEPSEGLSTGKIEASTNGTTWTTLATYDSTAGNFNAFEFGNVSLPAAFLNQGTVYIRFKFDGPWRYYWAIDNVTVVGQQTGTVTWAPQTGLYTNAAATVPYTGQAATTVYAKPAATATYTATATNPSGCVVTDQIVVNYTSTAAPTVANNVQIFCNSATVANLTATGTGILWYTSPTGGTALSPSTALPAGVGLYYASQTVGGCESSERVAVATLVNVHEAPVGDAVQTFCSTSVVTVADLEVAGDDITWYADVNTTTPLPDNTVLVDGITYYASQTINGCESYQRVAVTADFTVAAAPTANAVQSFCIDSAATVQDLIADGSSIQWYATEDGTVVLDESAPLVDGMMYYASQTINGCESADRAAVTAELTVTDAPDAAVSQYFCNEGTVGGLTAEGDGIQWYADAAGSTYLSGNEALVDGTSYFVSQTINGCESERIEVIAYVSVVAAPAGASTQVVEENVQGTATIEDIVVTGDGIVWYASEEAAIAGEDALQEGTLLTSGNTYYATQTVGDCTSVPFAVTVNVALGRVGFDTEAFTYYPNPVKDVLNLSYSADITSVTVFNLLGQKVLAKDINASTGSIDMTVLQEGTYIVNVTSGDTVKTIKVVKKQ